MNEPKPMQELTRIREERGLSQQRLADASGVNKATINQIERGRRSPNLETLEKLAGALTVEVGAFFPKTQSPLPLEEQQRADTGDVGEAFFVPLEDGEEEDTVTLQIHYVRLLKDGEPILQAVREASPEERAAMGKLEKSGQTRESRP
jgi:transcriptional regulator with XRE-family HTH domain